MAPPPLAYPHPGAPPEPPELPEGAPRRGPSWPAWTAPLALIAGFAAAIFGFVVVAVVAGIAGVEVDSHPPPAVQIAGAILQDIALVGSAVLFARLVTRPRPWHFGLRRPARVWSSAGWMALTYVGFLVFSVVWIGLLGIKQRDNLAQELGADRGTVAMLAVAALVTVVAPIAEEFFFRGYFFSALRNWRGPWVAALITGLVFGAIHGGSSPIGFLVPLSVLGFGLCLLYWRTGSLYPCICLHALNNSLAFGVAVHWGWQIPVLMVVANLVIAAVVVPLGRGAPGRPAVAIP